MESEVQPFRVTVYDKAFGFKGWVGSPGNLTVTLRWNGIGTASLTVASSHARVIDLIAPGARVVIEHDVAWDEADDDGNPVPSNWKHVLSGPVVSYTSQGPAAQSSITFTIADDWRILRNVLGWPVPTSAIGSQSGSEYDTRTGAAETVAKAFITVNVVTRLGMPVTVEATHGWGSSITVAMRMDPLADKLFPAVEQAGVGLTVRQSGSGLRVEARQPTTRAQVLTEESAAVTSWALATTSPDATRTVVGGQGDGTARAFRLVTDSTTETAWGDKIEGFQDATDADTSALLDARGAQANTENAAKSGLSVELADTPGLRLLRDFQMGDVLTLAVGGVTVTDTLREATLSWSPDGGVAVKPTVGGWDATPGKQLMSLVTRMVRAINKQQKR